MVKATTQNDKFIYRKQNKENKLFSTCRYIYTYIQGKNTFKNG